MCQKKTLRHKSLRYYSRTVKRGNVTDVLSTALVWRGSDDEIWNIGEAPKNVGTETGLIEIVMICESKKVWVVTCHGEPLTATCSSELVKFQKRKTEAVYALAESSVLKTCLRKKEVLTVSQSMGKKSKWSDGWYSGALTFKNSQSPGGGGVTRCPSWNTD